MSRVKIPKSAEHQVRKESTQACVNPKCREWNTATHELHHVDGDSSNSSVENLVLVCGSCHNQITRGGFSQSDVTLWKRMSQAACLPAPKGMDLKPATTIINNGGVAGTSVHIEKLTVKQERKGGGSTPIPGTIGANPDMRTYAGYLVKKYIDWRKRGARMDVRPFKPASANGILAEGFGSPASVMHINQSRFFDWIVQAQAKIDGTAFGRGNKKRNGSNYHSWDEHLCERNG